MCVHAHVKKIQQPGFYLGFSLGEKISKVMVGGGGGCNFLGGSGVMPPRSFFFLILSLLRVVLRQF